MQTGSGKDWNLSDRIVCDLVNSTSYLFVIMSLSGAKKQKLAALEKEKEAENQSSLNKWINRNRHRVNWLSK